MSAELRTAQLAYGGPGVGKTAYGVGSFWDWKEQRQIAEGRWLTFGREDNPALGVPEELRKRFTSTSLSDMDWVEKFRSYVAGLLRDARKGKHLDALVIDGMSELDLLYEEVFKNVRDDEVRKNSFLVWNNLLTELFGIVQMLDPNELGCHVIVTARVMERKKASQTSTGKAIAGDPDFIDFDYYPSLRGQFRLHFPHYFSMVNYWETDFGIESESKQRMPIHKMHMVRTGDFYVKNQWEHAWLKKLAGGDKRYQQVLVNPMFPQVMALLKEL